MLNAVYPRLMPEVAMQVDLTATLSQRVTLTELRSELGTLEAGGKVVSVRDEDQRLRWRITDFGRAEVA